MMRAGLLAKKKAEEEDAVVGEEEGEGEGRVAERVADVDVDVVVVVVGLDQPVCGVRRRWIDSWEWGRKCHHRSRSTSMSVVQETPRR